MVKTNNNNPKSGSQLHFQQVSFHYGQESSSIFQQLNVDICKGEFVSLLGPSGSGKSTFFRLATGLENPAGGHISINQKEEKNRLGKVGYMPQNDLLLPWRTVLENGVLPLEIKGVRKKDARKQVISHLEKFGLAGTEHKYPHELSGGMRQRVSFLRAMLSGNDILLLDEPFSALDSMTRFSMQEWLLEQWSTWQKTLIFITHDIEEALFLSDRVLLFTEPPIENKLEEVIISLSRPRDTNTRSAPEFMALKQDLLNKMTSKVQL
ncbi:ABC transporter ATP-binding protein [Alteribacillus sp. YIM 98480]|uniref:ABC transporter ATP-binding protein n=1 Tax=Alteribacillus sp. YIM 98480 TaxID=2606599 RepID=UPI00131D5961|nr:ABC transporter ATP-binding protein [Alteribacillus sp. YIM 98480]